MSKRLFPWLFAGCLLACPAAADDWFTVELIVFEHRDDASSGIERFPRNPGRPDILAAMRLLPPTEPRTLRDFEQLEQASRQLGHVWRALQRSSRYEPLVHAGWTQRAREPERASPVAIDLFTGVPLSPEPLMENQPAAGLRQGELTPPSEVGAPGAATSPKANFDADETSEPAWQSADRLRMTYAAPAVPQRLYGTVRLHLQRFLHVEADLLLTTAEPLPPSDDSGDWYRTRDEILRDVEYGLLDHADAVRLLEDLQAQPRYQSFRLRESRLIRSGEIHYLDHPRFGMIVTVRPLPAEEREAREQALDAAMGERELVIPPSERGQDLF